MYKNCLMKFLYLFSGIKNVYLILFMFMYIPYYSLYGMISEFGGYDEYSYSLVILLFYIFMMVNFMKMDKSEGNYILLEVLLYVLIVSFYTHSFMWFYVMFEFSVLPMFFIIVHWGYSQNRLFSSYYMMFYTMVFSMPFLYMMLYLLSCYETLNFNFLIMIVNYDITNFMMIMMMLVFMVKLPMYFLHLWLLKAHVDAPVYGSMILASVLLKLGGYGLIRIVTIFFFSLININDFFIYVGLGGSLICSLMCLYQLDMKVLVAYSSVVHMNFMLAGIFCLTFMGLKSAMVLMISHGLCSSLLFYMVNIFYSRSGSRLMLINKGMLSMMPSMMLMWFLACVNNMAAPISLNLVGEVILYCSLMSYSKSLIYLLMLIGFFSAVFCLYLFVSINHGKMMEVSKIFNSGKMFEFYLCLMHLIPLNMLVFNLLFIC